MFLVSSQSPNLDVILFLRSVSQTIGYKKGVEIVPSYPVIQVFATYDIR